MTLNQAFGYSNNSWITKHKQLGISWW
jgi:hypothetical protein